MYRVRSLCALLLFSVVFRPEAVDAMPGLLGRAADTLISAPLKMLINDKNGSQASQEPAAKETSSSFPIITSLKIGFPFGGTITSLKDFAVAVHSGDVPMAGMKLIELIRHTLNMTTFPGQDVVDSILEVLHGLFETLHPIWQKLKASEAAVIEISNETSPARSGLVSKGFNLVTSAFPKILT